jgi:hypothetical protein
VPAATTTTGAVARDIQPHLPAVGVVLVARGTCGGHVQHVSGGAATRIVAVVVVMVAMAAGTVGHGLEGHGVVELEGVGGGHGCSSVDGVKEPREGGTPACGREGSCGSRTRGSAVRGSKNASPCLDGCVQSGF